MKQVMIRTIFAECLNASYTHNILPLESRMRLVAPEHIGRECLPLNGLEILCDEAVHNKLRLIVNSKSDRVRCSAPFAPLLQGAVVVVVAVAVAAIRYQASQPR
uniref:Uncharacterized protein n=1 Tax=Glossina austeni TaxID=7395 RepID=A0A1A9V3I8_GLOAU